MTKTTADQTIPPEALDDAQLNDANGAWGFGTARIVNTASRTVRGDATKDLSAMTQQIESNMEKKSQLRTLQRQCNSLRSDD